jgi:membrane fusion protein, macrolide-specific efflux system
MNEPRPAPTSAIDTPAGPGPGRRWLRLSLGVAAVAVLAVGAWQAWRLWGGGAPPAEQHILATVQRGDIEDLVSATGALQPRDYVDVGAQVSGQVKRIAVEVGSEVKAGELLVEIDAETSAARVDASRAQLRSQQAQLAERELNVVKAERDLQRQKNLMAEDATTAETLQNADTAMRTARVQVQSLKAQIEQLQASMRVEEANLKFTRIFAPIAGTVVSITARQGQTLNANQSAPTLLRIADLSTMTVQTQVSEADVSKLRAGMPVYFTTLGSPGRRWNSQLKKVEPTPTVTNNVVLYNALFEVPNPNRSLMSQMTAQVFFIAAEARDVLMVPVSALSLQRAAGGARERGAAAPGVAASAPASPASMPRRVAGGPAAGAPLDGLARRAPRRATVRVAAADGSVQEREVLVGISNRVQAEILSGLNEGEKVIAGTRQPDTARRAAGASAAPGGPGLGGLGGTGAPPAGGGRAR